MDYRDIERKNILELSFDEAKKFLLKDNSYCNFNLPPYFSFLKFYKLQIQFYQGIL